MDSPTQALLGAVIAQLGFRERIGRDATVVAAAAAYSPDLDSFVAPLLRAFGHDEPFASIIYHRGISHSLLAVGVIAGVFALPWWALRRRISRKRQERSGQGADAQHASPPSAPRFRTLYLCTLLAVLSHPLLDWCTSYGTQLLAPITNARFAADCVGFIDIIYTPVLVLTLLACWIVRRLKHTRAACVIGAVGLVLSTGYLATGRILHDRAVAEALTRVPKGSNVISADAYPMVGTILLWRGVVRTDSEWIICRIHHLAGDPVPSDTTRVPRPVDSPRLEKVRARSEYALYDWFTMGRLRMRERREGEREVVELHDMRYGWPTTSAESLWPLRFDFDDAGNVVSVLRVRGRRRAFGLRTILTEMWKENFTP